MRPVEAVQWADALDVDVRDVPAVLGLEVSRMDGMRHEMAKVQQELAEAPNRDIAVGIWRAVSAWSAAQGQLMAIAADARRTA
ncbi:hypothetical protein [Phycicoccus sp. Soil748]|uniref:hypothetical protein n=1 Tax=Phycicoccus sp. Soil748 TaxID=1736397 RepID=UPI000AD275A6|nr:hypothetical protein [Phycicoccus sp. Soil748]